MNSKENQTQAVLGGGGDQTAEKWKPEVRDP